MNDNKKRLRLLSGVTIYLLIIFFMGIGLAIKLGMDIHNRMMHHPMRPIFDGLGLLFILWCLIHSVKTLPKLPNIRGGASIPRRLYNEAGRRKGSFVSGRN